MTQHFIHNSIQRTDVWELGGKDNGDGTLVRHYEVTARQELALREVVTNLNGAERRVAQRLAERVKQMLSGKVFVLHYPAGAVFGLYRSREAAEMVKEQTPKDYELCITEWDLL